MRDGVKATLAVAGLVTLLALELLTPSLLLGGAQAAQAPETLGHVAAHDAPQRLCDLPPGNGLRRYHLTAQSVEWEIAPGHRIVTWTFDGQIPGPTLCARVNDTIEVTLTNRLATIVSLHTHGLVFDAGNDGSFTTNSYVAPGGSRTYRFTAGPDSIGTWAYHDSVAEMDEAPFVPGVTLPESGEGIERGMYGAFVVVDPAEEPVDHEVAIFLGDVGPEVTRRGVVEVINGRAWPHTPRVVLEEGERVRFRVVNAGPNDPHDFYVASHQLVNAHSRVVVNGTEAAQGEHSVVLGALTFGDWLMTAGAPGSYEYACAVPGHRETGMRGTLTIVPKEA